MCVRTQTVASVETFATRRLPQVDGADAATAGVSRDKDRWEVALLHRLRTKQALRRTARQDRVVNRRTLTFSLEPEGQRLAEAEQRPQLIYHRRKRMLKYSDCPVVSDLNKLSSGTKTAKQTRQSLP